MTASTDFAAHAPMVTTRRVAAGVPGLDAVLDGGLPQVYAGRWDTPYMVKLRFAYPVFLSNGRDGQLRLTCRDLPELSLILPAEMDLVRMLDAAEVVMDLVVEQYICQGRRLPHPGDRVPGEYVLAPSATVIVKAAKHQPEPPLPPCQFGPELER